VWQRHLDRRAHGGWAGYAHTVAPLMTYARERSMNSLDLSHRHSSPRSFVPPTQHRGFGKTVPAERLFFNLLKGGG
jgi:hypothetical protein